MEERWSAQDVQQALHPSFGLLLPLTLSIPFYWRTFSKKRIKKKKNSKVIGFLREYA
jgi:hypothetical protein